MAEAATAAKTGEPFNPERALTPSWTTSLALIAAAAMLIALAMLTEKHLSGLRFRRRRFRIPLLPNVLPQH